MNKFPVSPGKIGAGIELRPADLRKKALGVHTGGPPLPIAPPAPVGLGTLGEDDELADGAVPSSCGDMSAGAFAVPKSRPPVALGSWAAYWDKRMEVHLPGRGGTFNVYVAGTEGPIVMCVHGGGYSGLTWSLVAKRLKDKYRVVAPDMRGHGLTSTNNDTDFSKETMSEDIIAIWDYMFRGSGGHPAGILVGHSMGGGLAVWAAAAKRVKWLEGVVVIDVVEGTALAALPHMMNILAGRPASFRSVEEAVTWAVRSGMSRNKEAAAVSMPSQLVEKPLGDPGGGGEGPRQWTWRTPLELSRPYWEGWYTGLSEAFLQLPCPKALLLAGTDRLDRALTIGQMQGKFQLILMPTAGHAIHEDEPDRAAEHLLGFLRRFRVGEPPLQFPRAPAGVRTLLPVVAGPTLGVPSGPK
ncbi:hypothetical protein VOLCADRAFT_77814 [Volvox carteri f. nagariensis]|uniref:protein phosphatase methylesterase-1 n=1 Tax=Volvox carteri f. nagariensis TaxID=3068 RepID=D8UHI9_VOLCA|nr:uncharacterized protein VOLCADRAFT_77814 [Volvox carteri f. nagariensis]EFJ40833.1 hypothetical protein VOLCADRAFT_77814 [Volvox carteri f. nagariensis]|eukprot:XP_002958102.1 hypothetical protein VOLCADRAFT_77814 [Volvox carteri f. nagariensis]